MAMLPIMNLKGETVGTPIEIGTITVNGTTYTKYKKIINFGALPNNSTKTVSTGIAQINGILAFYGVARNPTNGATVSLPNYNSNSNYGIIMSIDISNNVSVQTVSDRSSYTQCFVTIEYY